MGMAGVAGKVGVAQAVVEAFATRDHDRLLSLFSADVEFRTRIDVIGAAEFGGHEGVRVWLDAVDEKYDMYEIVEAEYRPGAGDAVFVSCHLRQRFVGERYGMARQAYWVFRVDQSSGRVWSFTSFRDRAEALAVAGLSA